jgi:BirA family transcriptional regulator, biotin operon repressor / biotin---[acetyl-CoA-carboxylase] ligase
VSRLSSPASDPASRRRPGLDEAALRAAVVVPGGLWSVLDVIGETGSTNADLVRAAAAAAADGTVLIAERQTRGRGRQGRTWVTPPGAALTFSVLLRPAVAPADRGWLPLLTGVALARAVHAATGVAVTLKWPNDLLASPLSRPASGGGPLAGLAVPGETGVAPGDGVQAGQVGLGGTGLGHGGAMDGVADPGETGLASGGGKLAGILAEQSGDGIVVGVGLNVSAGRDELPEPLPGALPPTSLALQGATRLDRGTLLVAVLAELEHWYRRWTAAAADLAPGGHGGTADGHDGVAGGVGQAAERSGVAGEYRAWCSTIGRAVRVMLPGGAELRGVASGIDQAGRLLVAGDGGVVPVSAGDVIHVR